METCVYPQLSIKDISINISNSLHIPQNIWRENTTASQNLFSSLFERNSRYFNKNLTKIFGKNSKNKHSFFGAYFHRYLLSQVQICNSCLATKFNTTLLYFFRCRFFIYDHYFESFLSSPCSFCSFHCLFEISNAEIRMQQGNSVMQIISVASQVKICPKPKHFNSFLLTPTITTYSQLLYKVCNHFLVLFLQKQ